MKKKILILGSEGQIGAHLVEFFKGNKKYQVLKFDLVLGRKFDIRNSNNSFLEKYIKKSDFIFFLAFDVGGSRYLKKYQYTYDFLINNLLILSNVFKLLKKHKKKFIFASSQMSNMDFSPYGVLKKIGESLTTSLQAVYVKFWNVYGVEKNKEKSHVITDFILMALKDKKIKMLTDGKESREFLYASDCSQALFLIMQKFNFFYKQKRELHLTTGKKVRIIDLAKFIKNIFVKKGLSIKIIPSKNKDNLQKNKNNTPDKFFRKFWKPKFKIQTGIEKIIDYYQINKN